MRTLPETCTTREAAKRLNVALSTVQTWVESGYLEAWKTPGGHRRIPLASLDKLMETGMALRAVDQPKPFQILVVEDEAHIRELYEAHIEAWNLPISLAMADNGYDGLVQAATAPDLLITDLSMPEMDGFKMIQALRNSTKTKSLPIIAVTGLNAEEIADRGGLPPDVTVLQKPIPYKELKVRVIDVMSKQSRFDRLASLASSQTPSKGKPAVVKASRNNPA
jgi:excisionase family DNA binding protein